MPSFEFQAQPLNNPLTAFYDAGQRSTAIQTGQQNLADRATLRGLAPGLAANDPDATATALTLPVVGGDATASGLAGMHADQRAALGQTLNVTGAISGAIINTPDPAQRVALWKQLRPLMVQAGAKDVPTDYPGDAAVAAHRSAALTAQQQIEALGNTFTGDPYRTPLSGPPGPSIGPGGVTQGQGRAPDDATAPGDVSNGNPLLGPLPASPPFAANAPSPTAPAAGPQDDATQPPGPDHPALPAVRDYARQLLLLPPEQRPAAYQAMLSDMRQKGAIHAPDQYPGDAAVAHLASGAPLPVQVAGPGAPTGAAVPGPDPGQPLPGYLPAAASDTSAAPEQQGADAVLARLRAAQPQADTAAPPASALPPVANQNGLLDITGGTGSAAPQNPLAVPQPAAPAASAQPASPPGANAGALLPGETPLYIPGKGPAPASVPGYQLTRRADGSFGMIRMPGAPPKIKSTPVGGFMVNTDENTGQEISRFPIPDTRRPVQVTQPGGGTTVYQGDKPTVSVGPNLRQPAINAMEYDRPKVDAAFADSQTANTALLRYNEMARIIPLLHTGPTAAVRGQVAARLEELGMSSDTIRRFSGLPSGSMFQEFAKLASATVGQAAKNDLGANVGVQALGIYAQANPGALLGEEANLRMTNFGRVLSQLSKDYTSGLAAHFNPQQAALLNPEEGALPKYSPLSTYNEQWLRRNTPQIAAATMGILNGDPFEKWTAGIGKEHPEDAASAIAMAARIDPNVMVRTSGGIPQRATDMLAHPQMPTQRGP